MIKEALAYLVGLGKPERLLIDEREYSTKEIVPVLKPQARTLRPTTLTAITQYLHDNPDQIEGEVIIGVSSPTHVEVFGPMFGPFRQRDTFMMADCKDILPQLRLGELLDQESFLIMLRSAFQNAHNREEVINIASHVADKAEVELSDDGLSQDVTIKKGQSQLQRIVLPNPIKLAPYRTFVEIEAQPASEFVFRISEGPRFRLIEADGGAWRMKALAEIKNWLEFNLNELEVANAKVIA